MAIATASVGDRGTILSMEVRFEAHDAAVAPASDLIAAVLAEYDAVAGRARRGGPSATPSDFSPPGGTYLVGFVGDTVVCGAGIKALAPGIAELKRLYVVPDFRGRGFAAAVLKALERAAEELGYEAVRIDCQRSNWPMYLAAGYRRIADYNSNPHADIWGEKPL
jgi:GNAT superfamily N-acetyltransferase